MEAIRAAKNTANLDNNSLSEKRYEKAKTNQSKRLENKHTL